MNTKYCEKCGVAIPPNNSWTHAHGQIFCSNHCLINWVSNQNQKGSHLNNKEYSRHVEDCGFFPIEATD